MNFPVSVFSVDMAHKVALPDLKRLGVPVETVRKIASAVLKKGSAVSALTIEEVRK